MCWKVTSKLRHLYKPHAKARRKILHAIRISQCHICTPNIVPIVNIEAFVLDGLSKGIDVTAASRGDALTDQFVNIWHPTSQMN